MGLNKTILRLLFNAMILLTFAVSGIQFAHALEPVEVARDSRAIDLTGVVDLYPDVGSKIRVQTAASADGIVRRIEVRAKGEKPHQDWA